MYAKELYMNVVINFPYVLFLIIQYIIKNMFYALRWINVLIGCRIIVYGQCIFVAKPLLSINYM
jgi:hypothetical protein